MSLLEPVPPRVLATRVMPDAPEALLRAYGADPARHRSLALITVDQDDPTYVALDEATKHAAVDVVFARSFYGGASHASGPLSGEILGVLAAADPAEAAAGLAAALRCLEHDACFYTADAAGKTLVFPHVVASVGAWLSREAGVPPGSSLAYLVAPPLEATIGFEAALKAADLRAARMMPPPTETNFAAAWLSGSLDACLAGAEAFAAAVVDVAARPR